MVNIIKYQFECIYSDNFLDYTFLAINMKSFPLDLTNCDKEPIHIPGKIQAHGFLIAVNVDSLTVDFITENIADFISAAPKTLLGGRFEDLENLLELSGLLLPLLKLGQARSSFDTINPYPLKIDSKPYYLIISLSGPLFLLEFEPVTLQYDIQNLIGKSVSEILAGNNLRSLLYNTAKEIKEIIHYDRVMIYKFLEEGHGEVIAEVKEDSLESFYGLHYPASDIPKQARELYKLNYTRIIADVNSASAAILTFNEEPLDLTHSVLRAVSPIHIQYLRNMGVESSFSISLICGSELWGLIACHNYSPKFIDYKAREAAKLIGKIVSSALEYRKEEEESEQYNNYQDALNRLSLQLTKDGDLLTVLMVQENILKDVTGATGVAVLFEDKVATQGKTPDIDQLKDLFSWLQRTVDDAVYYTHRLPEVFHPAKEYKETGSGIIACMIAQDSSELIVWFRPEQITTIDWAGDPNKPAVAAQGGSLCLSPRNSFEIWSQIIEHTALKWTQTEIANVVKVRDKVVTAINKKAGEIRILNDRLKRAYEELDTFSYTISHDLRTPLTLIKSYTELVMVTNKSLDEDGKQLLGRVIAGADKMGFLINEILKLARVGRMEVDMSPLDMDVLIKGVLAEVNFTREGGERAAVTLGDLPVIVGSEILVTQVFTNIIGNAVKYCSTAEHPEIMIGGVDTGEEIIYKIQDNGVGIAIDHQDKVYELFKRMDNVKTFEGTGVGLAIVKRIVEKHNARIWFESELKVGTIFYIAFKR